jgi:hypothetical protein
MTETQMPETQMLSRASSFGPILAGVVCVLLAAVAPGLVSSAQAECILQPNQQAPDGAHWSLHFDRDKNRRCWILVDAAGHDLSTPQQQPTVSSGLSSLQSFFGNLTGSQPAASQEAPASSAAAAPTRKPQVVNVNRAARTEQKADAHPAKHDMTPGERDALFEEFLRWHESQKITGTANPR